MGLSNNTTNLTITAKLTPFGRQELLRNKSTLVTNFALGDSEAYYSTTFPIQSGQMPDLSGNESLNGNSNNSTSESFKPKSLIFVDTLGNRRKNVKVGSTNVISTKQTIGYDNVSNNNLSYDLVDLNDYDTDPRVNWFAGFKLPITEVDKNLFTGVTSENGGYSDTAFSALCQDKILVIGVPASQYAETLDGKSIRLEISGSSNYSIYGTYQSTLSSDAVLDATYNETATNVNLFGENVALLFCDDIQKPNNDSSLSWSSKYGTTKAFTHGKLKYNYKSSVNTATVSDKPVGIAYLDKGLIVITDQTIINNSDINVISGSTNINFNSVTTQITQEVTCIADRGEFASSTNPTWSEGDTIRISEALLLDDNNNIIAVGRPDRHIEKTAQQFLAIGLKISV